MAILTLDNVCYEYKNQYVTVEAVKGISCEFEPGIVYSLMGASGSGKSTLLSLMAGLDLPTRGEVRYEGKPTSAFNLDKYRRESVAVIYQSFYLLPLLTVAENIMYPMELNGLRPRAARKRAKEVHASVGLTEDEFNRFPSMLSGGQRQRVAIARALGTPARIILADEPTGNLDATNSVLVMELLQKLAHEDGYCVIVVTHDPMISEMSDVVLRLSDGLLVDGPAA